MQFIILGSSGFVGSNIAKRLLKENHIVTTLKRPEFDILDINTYKNIDFSNSIIIDCVTSIDSAADAVDVTVYNSFKTLIDFINSKSVNFTYVYFSTMATLMPEFVVENHYLKAKLKSEQYLINAVADYKIIRLIFPFGKGEGENRLISRIIKKFSNNENVTVDNLTLNLTPIQSLVEVFLQLVLNGDREINFSDGVDYNLVEIAEFIKNEINSTGEIKLTGKYLNCTSKRYGLSINSKKIVFDTLKVMCKYAKK